MKFNLAFFTTIVLVCWLLSSCATIVHGRKQQTVSFTCAQAADEVEVKNLRTGEIQTLFGGSYVTIRLESSHKFFKRAKYELTFKKAAYADQTVSVTPKISGWYWVNIPVGVVGMFTIDPATGAMYRFKPKTYHVKFF